MKLKVLDQIHVSAVQADVLKPRQEIKVSKAVGAELLKKHPSKFEMIEDEPDEAEEAAAEKAEEAPKNKAEPAHADKAAPKRKAK